VWEYTKLITDALSSKGKLFSQFISVPSGPRLVNIIRKFKNITRISQMVQLMKRTLGLEISQS